MYLVYSALLAALLLLTLPYWLVQMARLGKYRAGLWERLGFVPKRIVRSNGQPTVWIHAVSVGEVLAISALVEQLRKTGNMRVLVSTTTQTGQRLARERFGAASVFYFPLDLPFAVSAYMRALRPKLVVLAETEFWPNFLNGACRSGARLAVVNARISDRSLPRYKRFRPLVSRILSPVMLFLAQSEEDARRLTEIGAPCKSVRVSGNLKFDVAPPKTSIFIDSLRSALAPCEAGPVIVAGSTVDGEEKVVLDAFANIRERWPEARLILAPRHKERFAEVAGLLRGSGVNYQARSQMADVARADWAVLLLDTIGELASAYALADVAFVGGSLVPRGGHNVLEPAFFGAPIVVGPYTDNFRDIMSLFRRAGALKESDGAGLASTFLEILSNDELRRTLGQNARRVLEEQRGATARTQAALEQLLAEGVDRQ